MLWHHGRWIFDGHIAGIGTGSGLRAVVGVWTRREYYGVTDLHRIDSASVSWDGDDAGPLAAVRPAVGFGFSSVPPEPTLARVRTTVEGAPLTRR